MPPLDELEARWQPLNHEVNATMTEWRRKHLRATFQEIENSLDAQLARLRAQMLQDLALSSPSVDLPTLNEAERPHCTACGALLAAQGTQTRTLVTEHDQTVELARSYATCPECGAGFFPLDEELALLPGTLTPSLQADMVRLGARMPFRSVVQELACLKHVTTTEANVRRHTERAGAAYVALQTEQVAHLERTTPRPPPGAAHQLLSADGALVPLRHGEWSEVKTVAIGEIQPPVLEQGERVVHTTNLSYFSRLAEHETFSRLATVETQRRGTERARVVCAVNDGAEWIQGFVDLQRHDAIRILDFSHAASYVAQVGQVVWGEGTPEGKAWLTTTLHELKHGSPDTVLRTLCDIQHELESGAASPESRDRVQTAIHYLDKRRAQMEYARFQAAGYPIGSGSVESGNKVVVEARLKGAGMHWQRENVNPMVALRDILCSARWDEDWPQITLRIRQESLKVRQQKQRLHWQHRHAPSTRSAPRTSHAAAVQRTAKTRPTVRTQKAKQPYPPPANHPWRHSPIGRARFKPYRSGLDPKS